MDALSRLCETAIEFYKNQNKPKTHLSVSEEQHFYSIDTREVESLSISTFGLFEGLVPEELDLPCLKSFSGKLEQLKGLVHKINHSSITELSLTINNPHDDLMLNFPNLSKLTLFFRGYNDDEIERTQRVDFSISKDIKELEIHNGKHLDYRSIMSLSQLEKLILDDDSLADISWMKDMDHSLKEIQLHGKIESLEGIETQKKCRILHLERNCIKDVSALKELKHLQYLNLFHNQVIDINELGFIKTVVFTEKDYDFERIEKNIDNWENQISRQWAARTKRIKEGTLAPFIAKRYSQMPVIKQMEEYVQNYFENDFNKINPCQPYYEYDRDYKNHYMEYATELYPFLSVTNSMRIVLERENADFAQGYPAKPGRIPFFNSGEDFYIVEAEIDIIEGEEGRVVIEGVSQPIKQEIEKKWDFYAHDLEYSFIARITVLSMYGIEPGKGIALAVIMAIKSAYYNAAMPDKTVFTTILSYSGKLREETGLKKSKSHFLKMIGYEQVCIMGEQEMLRNLELSYKDEMKFITYNTFEELEEKVFGL